MLHPLKFGFRETQPVPEWQKQLTSTIRTQAQTVPLQQRPIKAGHSTVTTCNKSEAQTKIQMGRSIPHPVAGRPQELEKSLGK